jgi:hypothetical protein
MSFENREFARLILKSKKKPFQFNGQAFFQRVLDYLFFADKRKAFGNSQQNGTLNVIFQLDKLGSVQ